MTGVIALEGRAGSLRGVEVGATFLTGVEVDVAAALLDSSTESPAERLVRQSPVPFRASSVVRQRVDGSFYAVDGPEHGTEVVPRTLATIEPAWLLAECDTSPTPTGWRLAGAECDLHDFGVGLVVLRWEPDADASVEVAALDDVLATLTTASRAVAVPLARRVADACAEALRDDPALVDVARGLDLTRVAVLPPVGDVLWLWHLLLVTSDGDDRAALVRDVARVVCPNDFRLLEHRDHTLAAGVHASVAGSQRGWEADARFLSATPRAQDPWWTLFWRLDRILLALQLRLEASLTTHALDELQSRADVLHEVSSRVTLLRSRLDSFLVASGARDVDAWNTTAEAWSMPYRAQAVDKKMLVLTHAYAEAVSRMSHHRSARVNFMIYVFTAFSVVASALAIAQFVQGPGDTGVAVRVTTLTVSALGALLAVVLSVRVSRSARAGRRHT